MMCYKESVRVIKGVTNLSFARLFSEVSENPFSSIFRLREWIDYFLLNTRLQNTLASLSWASDSS